MGKQFQNEQNQKQKGNITEDIRNQENLKDKCWKPVFHKIGQSKRNG